MVKVVADYEGETGRRETVIFVAEFELVRREEFARNFDGENLYGMPLTLRSRGIYALRPPVQGISSDP